MRFLPALVICALSSSVARAQTTLFEVTSGARGDDFGWAVANLGDVDGDGVLDFGAGAPHSSRGGKDAGEVFVYSGRTGQLLHTFAGLEHDLLGYSLCGAGDVDGDGFDDVLAGAPRFGWSKGSASLYSGRTGARLRFFSGDIDAFQEWGNWFGSAVANVGDADGDGRDDVAISAPEPNFPYVRVYSPTEPEHILHIDGGFGSGFGESLIGLGDADGDGLGDVVAGNPTNGNTWIHSGKTGAVLYVIEREDGDPIATPGDIVVDGIPDVLIGDPFESRARLYSGERLVLEIERVGLGLRGARFGSSLACADIDGDGVKDLVVGAPGFSSAHPRVGFVEGYSGVDHRLILRMEGARPREGLGSSLTALGDLDGDGYEEFAVGTADRRVRIVSPVDLPLSASPLQLKASVGTGGIVEFHLAAGAQHASRSYFVLGSTTGTSPGIAIGPGLVLPLVSDAYTLATLDPSAHAEFEGFRGVLDGAGTATARLDLTGGTELYGVTLHHAFGVADASGTAVFASNAIPTVVLPDPAQVPTCAFPVPPVAEPGTPLVFDGSASSDPNGSSLAHAWDFGDGTSDTGAVVAHAFAADGLYAVTHRVVEPDGNACECTRTVSVATNQPPDCSFAVSSFLFSKKLDASASSDADGSIVEYAWDFGDGQPDESSFLPVTFHVYAGPGSYTATLTLTDDDGDTSTCTQVVVVP